MKTKILTAVVLWAPLAACGDKSTSEPAAEATVLEPAPTMPTRTAPHIRRHYNKR
jgi:hypothetical protein